MSRVNWALRIKEIKKFEKMNMVGRQNVHIHLWWARVFNINFSDTFQKQGKTFQVFCNFIFFIILLKQTQKSHQFIRTQTHKIYKYFM